MAAEATSPSAAKQECLRPGHVQPHFTQQRAGCADLLYGKTSMMAFLSNTRFQKTKRRFILWFAPVCTNFSIQKNAPIS